MILFPIGQCRSDSDCPPSSHCSGGSCMSPCAGACGPNALCHIVGGRPQCSCPTGFILRDDGRGAACARLSAGCSGDVECVGAGEKCIRGSCQGETVYFSSHHSSYWKYSSHVYLNWFLPYQLLLMRKSYVLAILGGDFIRIILICTTYLFLYWINNFSVTFRRCIYGGISQWISYENVIPTKLIYTKFTTSFAFLSR